MSKVTGLIIIWGLTGLFIGGCGNGHGEDPGDQALDSFSSAARTRLLSTGDIDCPNGGILVESGIDENGNGLLDDNEVDTSEKVCNGLSGINGVDGLNSVMSATLLGPNDLDCSNGGALIEIGIDENSNGLLDSAEANSSQKICNGIDGVDGLVSLISMSEEPPGINCEFGGTRIDAGIDTNGNNLLDIVEVTATDYNCTLVSDNFAGLMFIGDTRMDGLEELQFVELQSRSTRTLLSPQVFGGGLMQAILSPDKSRIAVIGNIDSLDVFELYVVNLVDNTTPVKVSGSMIAGGNVTEFYWSPDGRRLAYRADQDTDEVFELYTVFADGAGRLKISGAMTTGGTVLANTITWSPDSIWLAYEADQDEDEVFQLYAARADGSQNHRVSGPMVVGGDIWLGYFQWSPDSTRLAYRADQDTDGVYELYTALPDGSGQVKVSGPTASGGSVDNFFKWSPDGSRIAYRSDEQVANRQELYTVLADGTDRNRVSVDLGSGGDVVHNSYNWSPNGTQLAYEAYLTVLDLKTELFAVSPDGSTGAKLSGSMTTGGNLFTYSWSPNSSRVAYLADQDVDQSRELFTVHADGSSRVKVNGAMQTGGNVDFYEWSPNGNRLLYRSDETVDNQLELYSVLENGTGRVKVSDVYVTGRQIVGMNWSPDGSQISFMADQRVDDQFELYTSTADGSARTRVSGDLVNGGDIFSYSWSPDSTQIAYTADQEVDEKLELYVVNADGTDKFKASPPSVDNGDIFNFEWISP